jgi:hypothetical protein
MVTKWDYLTPQEYFNEGLVEAGIKKYDQLISKEPNNLEMLKNKYELQVRQVILLSVT